MATTAGDPDSVGEAPSQTAPAHTREKQAKPRRRFSISVINFWLDATLLTLLCALGWVSATLQIVFPAPTAADGWILWGLSYDQSARHPVRDTLFACPGSRPACHDALELGLLRDCHANRSISKSTGRWDANDLRRGDLDRPLSRDRRRGHRRAAVCASAGTLNVSQSPAVLEGASRWFQFTTSDNEPYVRLGPKP